MSLWNSAAVQIFGPQIAARLALSASSLVRGNLRTALQDFGYRYFVHPDETAQGIGNAQLTFGFAVGDARRYGCDPTGGADSAAGFALWSKILGTQAGRIAGTFTTSVGLSIPSNATVNWDAGSVVKYTGTTSALQLSSAKNVTLRRPKIDLTGAGLAAVGLSVAGAWFVDLEHPEVIPSKTTAGNTQVGILIATSASGAADFGAYAIRILNPNLGTSSSGGPLQYGILTQQTAGDTVQVTHLDIAGGWINTGTVAGIKLANCSSFRVVGTTLEGVADGLQYAASNNGFISLGEVDASGYAINPLDAGSSHIQIVAPSMAGSYASGYLNTANQAPDLIGVNGELRLSGNGNHSAGYAVSYTANYALGSVLNESVAAGGPFQQIRNVNGGLAGPGIHQLLRTAGISSSGTVANNLTGAVVFQNTTTANVALQNAEPDANYSIFCGFEDNPGGTVWVSNKTVNGFTLNCSVATGVTASWFLVR